MGEALGFHWISVADSPTVYEDSYLHQLEVARAAQSVSVGPMVSHVVARHPVIVGNLLATLNSFTGGRAIGTLGTGNSSARGLGMKPATASELAQGVNAIRSYWSGERAQFRDSFIPATGIHRDACPLLIAADGPRAAALAAEPGDGLLYGGTLDGEVRRARLKTMGGVSEQRQAWIAPTVSLAESYNEVRDDLGAMVVAMANRAMRGDLDERRVPADVREDVVALRGSYDYGFHADNLRPKNAGVVSDRLSRYLIDSLCVWGDDRRWQQRLDEIGADGWTGVMFILGQGEQLPVVKAVAERLKRLGHLDS